ncbi:MAG: ATP-binding protein [Phenylobacterium sp.]|uniref:ATP-binding protein n=1 Tax=Phenylobacterium sp. TaxID=1871053 RepID=UPI002728DA70|nr:ATP-binding protein [Phenylobacterium sp.]MDO8910731.1 ATP-binding protein [Phenylobacterium sp.]MDO9247228.1 ATP-binding protein [Phenylobacterium sp.]MDP3100939.1 ATP-binding protein [Phenylobacterium sp.]MDP3870884.1 ATP-binding protein [Phenylobacterium sp.]
MTQQLRATGPAHNATFHARVAGIALITTMVVLIAACLTFMLQQWAVAREQSHINHVALSEITAGAAGPALSQMDAQAARAAISALSQAQSVTSARLLDSSGQIVATYQRAQGAPGGTDVIRAPVKVQGLRVGELVVDVMPPALGALLPQFVALTGALFFGGVGVALFLARGLAHRVIAPVQKLSDAMHDVAASGSFAPVQVEAQDALFRSLTASFNHLLTKLDEREQALQRTLQELVEARDAANAANTLKSQFLANMSHEIRTPLNGVLAMAEVMSMGQMDDIQRERLEVIRQSGGLLLAVLNDVLDLSKIEAGKLTLLVDDFDLESAIAPARESFAIMAEKKGLDFKLDVEATAQGAWRGDADRLGQIVGNLLSNAVKFTQAGEVAASFSLNPDTGAVRLTVRDTGLGIPAEKQATLFEKFVQADNSATRRFGGTGLGLAICRELTQMMGGAIWVDSREGKGSTFTVELPLERGVAVAAAPAAASAGDNPEEGALRLLAAEDNPTNQQVLAAVMGSLGLDIDIVADGKLAFEAWRDGAYDLILMDIQMPVMDGIDAARAIRAAEREQGRPRTPIVALTANALSHQVEEYLAAGMDGHVAKPIEIAKLYEAISRALNDAAQNAAAASAAAAA